VKIEPRNFRSNTKILAHFSQMQLPLAASKIIFAKACQHWANIIDEIDPRGVHSFTTFLSLSLNQC
jgi:hypothetical protein